MSNRIVRDTPTPVSTESTTSASAAVLEPKVSHVTTSATMNGSKSSLSARRLRAVPSAAASTQFHAFPQEDHSSNHQAELFYLQKQISLQTQMVFILEDGTRLQGVIEWYDRNSIKIRGKSRVLVYKSAIKYLYKAGEVGSGQQE